MGTFPRLKGVTLALLVLCYVNSSYGTTSFERKLQEDTDISEFYTMLFQNAMINMTIQNRPVTIFAPTNKAFQDTQFDRSLYKDDTLVRYHMLNEAKTTDQLNHYLITEQTGNPLLWVTHKTGSYHNEIYVNNARIIINHSNVPGKNLHQEDQYLHKIDEVLIPVMPVSSSSRMYNPNAWEFINNYETFANIKSNRLRIFREMVKRYKKEEIFTMEGGHTFFIPVDDGFREPNSIDAKVIDGHVIPKRVLFTKPTNKDEKFPTLADGDNIKVFITFSEETEEKATTIYIKSHTLMGDQNHTKGVVMATIKEANIPVKNGVIHLIHKPLMVVDYTVKQFLEQKENGILSKFCQEIEKAGQLGVDFKRAIERAPDVTLFAPTNAAWEDENLQVLLRKDLSRAKEIINMHLVVDKKIYADSIVEQKKQKAQTINKKYLFFDVIKSGDNSTVTVDGGGVTASIIQADIAAKNGVIHIIDRVLGVPYVTVFDKLRQDPTLNDTFILGSSTRFNEMLRDPYKQFTFFVPSYEAWKSARLDMASAIKKIFMPDFKYHAEQILERHLVVSDKPYTMELLKQLGNNTTGSREVQLEAVRDKLTISVEEQKDNTFYIHWKGRKIPVRKPNVECTNGIIHVIDYPFIEQGDIRTSAAVAPMLVPHLIMLLIIKCLLL